MARKKKQKVQDHLDNATKLERETLRLEYDRLQDQREDIARRMRDIDERFEEIQESARQSIDEVAPEIMKGMMIRAQIDTYEGDDWGDFDDDDNDDPPSEKAVSFVFEVDYDSNDGNASALFEEYQQEFYDYLTQKTGVEVACHSNDIDTDWLRADNDADSIAKVMKFARDNNITINIDDLKEKVKCMKEDITHYEEWIVRLS